MSSIVTVKVVSHPVARPVLVQKVERLEDRSLIKDTYMLRAGNEITLTVYGAEEIRVSERA